MRLQSGTRRNGWQAARLRQTLREAQAGSAEAWRAVLQEAAARARVHHAGRPDREEAVQAALLMLHRVRHTWHPSACPDRWIDAVVAASWPSAQRAGPGPGGLHALLGAAARMVARAVARRHGTVHRVTPPDAAAKH